MVGGPVNFAVISNVRADADGRIRARELQAYNDIHPVNNANNTRRGWLRPLNYCTQLFKIDTFNKYELMTSVKQQVVKMRYICSWDGGWSSTL